ncbi:cytoplasmic tRNA 2-thiolation protein 2 [Microplitis mediator]|uniref:cytoplasmic tRNA 2-thiolation protein 2 n=1 Tax=Microplitis mediator TaxID=375433 RepID=UPI002553DDC8|nr:cytoplasmic tRNA 2-thiolation protein 2 [Microplitis mediator]
MCSINDDCGGQELMKGYQDLDTDDAKCRKCNENNATIKLRGKDNYCNECFLLSATHKFRATLGKSKLVRPKDKVLVGYSGTAGSVALLNLIRAGMHESVHKRLVFESKVIYIDDGMLKKQDLAQRQAFIDQVRTQIKSLGFPGYVTSLSECFNADSDVNVYKLDNYNCEDNDDLNNLFDQLTNDTAKQDLLKKLRYRLIASAAKKLECGKVFLGDDATNLAVDILSNVAVGRGAQLAVDVGFVDDRFKNLMILRPMRDFTRVELDHYLNIHGLKTLDTAKVTKSSDPFASIQQLTEDFILDLESQFTGTVSTVFRTGDKVCASKQSHNDNKSNDEICVICNALMDTRSLDDATAIKATLFSRFISTQGIKSIVDVNVDDNYSEKSNCDNCQGDCFNSKDLTLQQLRKFLCYGCKLIFNYSFDCKKLPPHITNKLREIICMQDMREQIKDFLL